MPSKSAKYGIRIWAACDANTSYALNMQLYTGKPIGRNPRVESGYEGRAWCGTRSHNITYLWQFFHKVQLESGAFNEKAHDGQSVPKKKGQTPCWAAGNKEQGPSVFHVCLHRHHSPSVLLPQKGSTCCTDEQFAQKCWYQHMRGPETMYDHKLQYRQGRGGGGRQLGYSHGGLAPSEWVHWSAYELVMPNSIKKSISKWLI